MRNNNKLTYKQFVKIYHAWCILIVLHMFVILWKFCTQYRFYYYDFNFCHAKCICLYQRYDNVNKCTIFKTFSKIDEKKSCANSKESNVTIVSFLSIRINEKTMRVLNWNNNVAIMNTFKLSQIAHNQWTIVFKL